MVYAKRFCDFSLGGRRHERCATIQQWCVDRGYSPIRATKAVATTLKRKTAVHRQACSANDQVSRPGYGYTVLQYVLDKTLQRPEICVIVDDYHAPDSVVDYFKYSLGKLGYPVAINEPLAGSIGPISLIPRILNWCKIFIKLFGSFLPSKIVSPLDGHMLWYFQCSDTSSP